MIIIVELVALCWILYILITYVALTTSVYFKQRSCSHDQGINETQACDAICKSCGKNLGFIGTEANKVRRGQ